MSLKRKEIQDESDLETSRFSVMSEFPIAGFESIYLMSHKAVWKPTSAASFIQSIIDAGIAEDLKGKKVWDIGAGIGPLGISFLRMGADFVLMTDTNPYAEEAIVTNARLNTVTRNGREQRPIKGVDFDFILSDALNDLDPKDPDNQFDYIFGNLPMNPFLENVHDDNLAYKSNQNGPDGRDVLDSVIANAKKFLKPGGKLIITCSSRQNQDFTEHSLTKNFPDKWRYANYGNDGLPGVNEALKGDYHGQFIMYWDGQTNIDNSMRAYRLDNMRGLPYFQVEVPRLNKVRKIVYMPDEVGVLRQYIITTNGKPENTTTFKVVPMDEPVRVENFPIEEIPLLDETSPLCHRYHIIIAEN